MSERRAKIAQDILDVLVLKTLDPWAPFTTTASRRFEQLIDCVIVRMLRCAPR